MKRTFPNTSALSLHLSATNAQATHYTPDGLPCRYLIYGKVWHVPRNAPLMLTKVA